MAAKISIYVDVPGLNTIQNFMVPEDMTIVKVEDLVTEILKDEFPEVIDHRMQRHFLMQKSTGKILDEGASLKQYGSANGETFILL